jgi:hypothetical protein
MVTIRPTMPYGPRIARALLPSRAALATVRGPVTEPTPSTVVPTVRWTRARTGTCKPGCPTTPDVYSIAEVARLLESSSMAISCWSSCEDCCRIWFAAINPPQHRCRLDLGVILLRRLLELELHHHSLTGHSRSRSIGHPDERPYEEHPDRLRP